MNRQPNSDRGFFGIGIENVKTTYNIGTLWRSCLNLGADFMFVIGKRYKHQISDTVRAYRHIPLYEYDSINELAIPRDCKIIGIEIVDGAKDLASFEHPQRAIYLLGAEDHGLSKEAMRKCHDFIQIDSNMCMNVAVVGSIIMYDRKTKAKRGK